jgi:hypothetical protein
VATRDCQTSTIVAQKTMTTTPVAATAAVNQLRRR